MLVGVVPLIGAIVMTYILVKSIIDLSKPENSESGESWFGLGPPLVIAIGFMILGVILMLLALVQPSEFFQRKARGRGSGGARCLSTIVLGYDDSPSANAALAETIRPRAAARGRRRASCSATT